MRNRRRRGDGCPRRRRDYRVLQVGSPFGRGPRRGSGSGPDLAGRPSPSARPLEFPTFYFSFAGSAVAKGPVNRTTSDISLSNRVRSSSRG